MLLKIVNTDWGFETNIEPSQLAIRRYLILSLLSPYPIIALQSKLTKVAPDSYGSRHSAIVINLPGLLVQMRHR